VAFAAVFTILILLLIILVALFRGGGSLDVRGYVDSVRPLIQKSNETGNLWRTLPVDIERMTRADLQHRMDDLSNQSAATADEAIKSVEKVPGFAVAAHGYLVTALRVRAEALKELRPAVLQAVALDEALAVSAVQIGVNKLMLGDDAYKFFSDDVTAQLTRAKQQSEVPDSAYVSGTELSQPNKQADFVRRMRQIDALKAQINVGIADFKPDPEAARQDPDGVFDLPPAESFQLRVTVKNKGNQRVEKIFVKAQMFSPVNTVGQSDSDTIEALEPGEVRVVPLLNLKPDRGDVVNTLTLTLSGVADQEPSDDAATLKFRMAK
jgi:hypothetical protein